MPYTCVRYQGYGGARVGGVAGVLSFRVGARRRPPRRDAGSTRGTRGGGQRAGAVRARAQRSERCFCWRTSVAHMCEPAARGNKRRKNHVSQISSPDAFLPRFFGWAVKGIQN